MSVDDEPLIFVQSCLKYPQCNCMFTNDLTQDSMHQILIRNGIPLFRAARELESIPAGLTEEKYLLMAPGAGDETGDTGMPDGQYAGRLYGRPLSRRPE